MARKKTSKQKTNLTKEFASSPFKALKGLPAFEQTPSTEQKVNVKKDAESLQRLVPGDQDAFADEMAFLGVKPLSGATLEPLSSSASTDLKAATESTPARPESDTETFLEAVGAMEKSFKNEWPEEESSRQAVPRRMKQVARGQLKPEAELDLHGLTVTEASVKIRFFLQDAAHHGFQTVLIITGKGLHSSDGPVLRQAMETLLCELDELVVEWGVAPRQYGGDGALVVFLRRAVVA